MTPRFKCFDCRGAFDQDLAVGGYPACPACGSQNIIHNCEHETVAVGAHWECPKCGSKEKRPGLLR